MVRGLAETNTRGASGGRVRDPSRVLTVGHSTRTLEEFSSLLWANGATLLADVRRFPHSPRHPWFDAAHLPRALEGAGIGYEHLPELGGRRRPLPDSPNAGWRNPSFQGYADHMGTSEFREGLGRLLGLCGMERVCLMCSEAVWWRCHRRMISDALVARGLAVAHILGLGRAQPHELTPWAEVVDDGGDPLLLYPPVGPAEDRS